MCFVIQFSLAPILYGNVLVPLNVGTSTCTSTKGTSTGTVTTVDKRINCSQKPYLKFIHNILEVVGSTDPISVFSGKFVFVSYT